MSARCWSSRRNKPPAHITRQPYDTWTTHQQQQARSDLMTENEWWAALRTAVHRLNWAHPGPALGVKHPQRRRRTR